MKRKNGNKRMSINTLLNTIGIFVNSNKREQYSKRKNLKIILTKRRKQSKMLREKISDESDSKKRKQLQREFDTVYAQRKKGVKLLKSL